MDYSIANDDIRISLPITTPTGKVRVKRPVAQHASDPVACRSVPLQSEDYLEWQISYDTDSLQEPSILREVILNKPAWVRYGCELTRLIVEARRIGILADTIYQTLREMVFSPLTAGIEEIEQIQRESDPEATTIATKYGFARHYLRVPNYLKLTEAYGVEIKITHKQKAVGNQAMIYVNLPVCRCCSQSSAPLTGRCAEKNEKTDYIIDSTNVSLIFDTVVAFALASVGHRNDLRMIFECLK